MSPTACNTGGQRGLLPETRSKPGVCISMDLYKDRLYTVYFQREEFPPRISDKHLVCLSRQVPKANCILDRTGYKPKHRGLISFTGCGRKDVVCMCEYIRIRIRMSFNGQVCLHIRGICYSDRSSTVQQNDSNRTGHR